MIICLSMIFREGEKTNNYFSPAFVIIFTRGVKKIIQDRISYWLRIDNSEIISR